MQAGGRDANENVATVMASVLGRTGRTRHGTDRKAGKVEIAARIKARHLRRLATDQRAAAFNASVRNTLDNRRRRVHIQFSGRVIVEKEQWLGSLHDDVVDAHRDRILSNSSEPPGFDGDFELRAHAIRGATSSGSLRPAAFRSNTPPKPPR